MDDRVSRGADWPDPEDLQDVPTLSPADVDALIAGVNAAASFDYRAAAEQATAAAKVNWSAVVEQARMIASIDMQAITRQAREGYASALRTAQVLTATDFKALSKQLYAASQHDYRELAAQARAISEIDLQAVVRLADLNVRHNFSALADQVRLAGSFDAERLAELFETARPVPAWRSTLDEIRQAAGTRLRGAPFDAIDKELAESASGSDEPDIGWFWRLPDTKQAGFLLLVLAAIHEFTEFLSDVTGEQLPPALESATKTMFALAAVVLFLAETASPPDDE